MPTSYIWYISGLNLGQETRFSRFLCSFSVPLSKCQRRCFNFGHSGLFHIKGKAKGKVHPITGHESPEGEQMYTSTLPSTSALDGGGWSRPRPGRFIPRNDPVPIVQEAGWAPGTVWTGAENLATHRDSIPGPSSP